MDGSANATLSVTVANDSHTHDGRYYTETEADSRFVNVTGDTITSGASTGLTINHDTFANGLVIHRNHGTNAAAIKFKNNTGDTGILFANHSDQQPIWRKGTATTQYKIFNDSYHPNADKWTTARTLSLSGDASGSVSWDGSSNATLSVTVADNSHNHDKLYGGSGWQTVNLNTIADGISSGYMSYEQFSSSSSNMPPVADNANGVITVGQHSGGYTAQLAFSSNGNIYWRDNPTTSYGSWRKMWDDGNDGSGSGLDADLLDGYHESTFMRRSANSALDMNNNNITEVNHLQFNDPGPGEGLEWVGGNGWKIYESPDNLTTNGAGNLQFVTGSTRRMTLGSDGGLVLGGANLTVGIGPTSSNIYMTDSNNTTRRIHCNSNRIGFLSSTNIWGSYASNGGDWFSDQSVRSPIFYDSNDTAYYGNFADTGDSAIRIAGSMRVASQKGIYTSGSWVRMKTAHGYIDIGPANSGHAHIYTDRTNFYMNKTLNINGGTQLNTGDVRADIFYDKNNTAYYTNPASTSSLNAVNAVTLNTTSDIRFKSDLEKIEGAVDKVKAISGYTYQLDGHEDRKAGLIAQEVEEVLPEAVKGSEHKKLLDYHATIALLVEAVKEQQEQIETLKQRIEKMES